MRGLLIFIACAIPVALATPGFWTLVNMEFGAQPITLYHQDGVAQQTISGPKSPWPDWALKPEGGTAKVSIYYAPAPGHPGLGFAYVETRLAAAAGQAAYAEQLAKAGWSVALRRADVAEPTIPPRAIRMCLVAAQSGTRSLLYALQDDRKGSVGQLHWLEGRPPKPTAGSVEGPC